MKLHKFNSNIKQKELHLKQNKNKYSKRLAIIIGSFVIILGVICFTFAKFEEGSTFNIVNGSVGEFVQGDANVVAIYVDNEKVTNIPAKTDGKVFDRAECTNGATATWNDTDWNITINLTQSTKCKLYFNSPPTLNTYLRSLTANNTTIVQDDTTDDHNMRYIGADPDNYVYFNCSTTNPEEMNSSTCETWRVIGVFNNGSYSGTTDQLVKIVRNDYIEGSTGLSWDYTSSGSYNNNWNTAELQTFLNSDVGYYGGGTSYSYYNNSTTATTLDTSSYSIKDAQRNMIATVNWKIGAQPSDSAQRIPSTFYTNERGSTAAGATGSTNVWNNGKVGLPYMSDYAYATSGGSIGISTCLSTTMYVSSNTNWRTDSSANNNCATNSWLINRVRNQSSVSYAWSLVPLSDYTYCEFGVFSSFSYGAVSYIRSLYSYGVLPAVYLQSSVTCANCDASGAGSESSPFKLVME